jgi:uncharacterized protein
MINIADNCSLEVVFKVQETCNINCSYCYMYNVGNTLFQSVPKQASIEVCGDVANFVVDHFQGREPPTSGSSFTAANPC